MNFNLLYSIYYKYYKIKQHVNWQWQWSNINFYSRSCLSSYYGKCEKILISWVNMSTQRLCKTSLLTKDTLVSRVPSPLSVSKLILSFDVNLILKQLPYFSVSYIYDIFGQFLIFYFHIGKVKMFQLGRIWIFKLLVLFEYFWLGKC